MTDYTPQRLLVLWTSGDKETSANMVLMYSINTRRHAWWDEVVLLIWGASQRLACEDSDIQALLAAARAAGVRLVACLACAQNLDLVAPLQRQGVEVFYTGQFLTDWLKSGDRLLTV
jgi:hypothetical protein